MGKPDQRGFKPGANMPQQGYDPAHEGMSDSGNHAVGHPGNDTPYGNDNLQQDQGGRSPARSEQTLRQDNQNRASERNQQSAEDAAKAATHRDQTAGARADDYTRTNKPSR
ncbi:hypothetical protein [Duganella callida]|uniref:Uncharacterized protein n=1 Tax=Duganella callida TaxID=2561932 RepID=A0A4Y9S5K6_9BURK|nr:hypothetical protein [Duganella callida]TFW16634.1 hypothetical protein E4L98_22905 [Duganella callida]